MYKHIKKTPILFILILALLVSAGLYVRPVETSDVAETPCPHEVEIDDVILQSRPGEDSEVLVEQLYIEMETVTLPEASSESEEPVIVIDEYEANLIAKTLYGEYRGSDKLQQSGVVWCILNRCDYYGKSIESIVTAPNQFLGYNKNNPVLPELYEMAADVMTRWKLEQGGQTEVGRTLPAGYMWFHGDGIRNHFRNAYRGNYTYWDWSLPNPYDEVTE